MIAPPCANRNCGSNRNAASALSHGRWRSVRGILPGFGPRNFFPIHAYFAGVKANAVLKNTTHLLMCAVRHRNSDKSSNTGAALAFYSAFSLAPLLIIILTLAGWIVGANEAYGQIGAQLQSLFGRGTADILLGAMKSSQVGQGMLATAMSVGTLLVGATTVLAALEQALEQIWNANELVPSGVKGWLRTRFLSLGFILALGFLLLVSLTITTALSGIRDRIAHDHATLVGMVGSLDFILSLAMVALLFAFMYRYMPARRLPWSVVLGGGLLTAALFDLGRWAIGIYLAHSTQPSAFGAASSFAALLLWLYYTAQIFLFGAEFTACLGGIRDSPPQPGASRPATPAAS
jgi:membrane protein